jgi:hypothetical protein
MIASHPTALKKGIGVDLILAVKEKWAFPFMTGLTNVA